MYFVKKGKTKCETMNMDFWNKCADKRWNNFLGQHIQYICTKLPVFICGYNSNRFRLITELSGYYYGADNSALRDQNLTAAAMLILGTVSACGTIVTIGVSHMRLNSYRSRASYIALSSLSGDFINSILFILAFWNSPLIDPLPPTVHRPT